MTTRLTPDQDLALLALTRGTPFYMLNTRTLKSLARLGYLAPDDPGWRLTPKGLREIPLAGERIARRKA